MKKSLSILFAFALFCSMILQFDNAAYATEVGNVITEARITDEDGNPFPAGAAIGAWQSFRLYAEFKLPNHVVKEGDTTTIILPVGIDTAPPDHFDIKDGDQVVARATMHNENPAKIVLTYTKYVEEYSDVQGSFYVNVAVNSETQTETGNLPVTITVDGKLIPAGHINYNPPHFVNTQLSKWGWMTSDKTRGKYDIRINQDNHPLVNAKFVDTILSDSVEFDEDSLHVWQGKWENHTSYVRLADRRDVTTQLKNDNRIKFEGKKLTIDLGNTPPGDDNNGFQIFYEVKLNYEPVAGEIIRNKAEFTNGGDTIERERFYTVKVAGGVGHGYKYKIQVIKTGKDGALLSGAKFDVIRVRNNQKVGEITTGQDGTAEIGGLLLDDYRLVETVAPNGYNRLTNPIEVHMTDFDHATKKVIKSIVNQPTGSSSSSEDERISISVEKKWIGPVGNPVIVQLKKVGSNTILQEQELNATKNWKHTFSNLDKYEADGVTLIRYEIVEKFVPDGYTVSYEENGTGKWVIKNTWTNKDTKKSLTKKVTVQVTKKWENAAREPLLGEHPTIQLQLLKNGQAEGALVLLSNGTTAYTWTNLDKTDPKGKEYVYTVQEVDEIGNVIQLEGKWYVVSYGGTMKDGLTVTNREKTPWTTVPLTRDIKVTKKWQNDTGAEIVPTVDEITVELYQDGVATGKNLKLTKENQWTAIFEKLELADEDGINHQYTIKEVGENGEKITLGGTSYRVSYDGSMGDEFVIINKKETTIKKIRRLPKTGDGANPALYALAVFALGTVLTTVGYRRRKNVN